jgi:hypothetical protein
MLVDEYFTQIEATIAACGSIRTKVIHKDKRSDYVGYFRADLYLYDSSLLHVREFVFTRTEVIKDMYAYHYQDADGQLIFRYDNTQHFPICRPFPTTSTHSNVSWQPQSRTWKKTLMKYLGYWINQTSRDMNSDNCGH